MASPPTLADLVRTMARMRAFEECAGDLWAAGMIPGELHLGIGEEGIVAGVVSHLRDGDATALDHRSTPPLIGRGADPVDLLLELCGHPDGLCGGRGGHMHLFDRSLLATSSGIVGASGPAACGLALSHRRLRPGAVAVAFFGEGAINQGMMLESWNLAVAWNLPVVFVCKDNGWAITTRSKQMTGGDPVERAAAFGLRTGSVDGSDVMAVGEEAGRLIHRARSGRGPGFLHATCHRPRGHFEGDPLLRTAASPDTMIAETREMASAVVSGEGTLRQRVAGMTKVMGTVAAVAMSRMRTPDPLTKAAHRLDDGDQIVAAARTEIEEARDAVLRRLSEREEE